MRTNNLSTLKKYPKNKWYVVNDITIIKKIKYNLNEDLLNDVLKSKALQKSKTSEIDTGKMESKVLFSDNTKLKLSSNEVTLILKENLGLYIEKYFYEFVSFGKVCTVFFS